MIENKKILLDKVVLSSYISWLLINILQITVAMAFSGMTVLFITYFYYFYFAFVYGKSDKTKDNVSASLVLFLFLYIIEFQFFYTNGPIYSSFGIPFSTSVWNLLSYVPTLLSAVCIIKRSHSDMLYFGKLFGAYELLTICVYSIIRLTLDPSASKLTATGRGPNIPFLAGYGIIYGMAIMIPVMLAGIVKSHHRIHMILAVAVMIYCIYKSSYMIAFFAILIGILCNFLLIVKTKAFRNIITLVVVCGGFFLIINGTLAEWLQQLSTVVSSYEISIRLLELSQTLRTGETFDTTVRIDMYLEGLKAFTRHPILGNIFWDTETSFISGHSSLIDILSGCGLLGFVPYVLYNMNIYRFNRSLSDDTFYKASVTSSLIVFFFVSAFNPILSGKEIIAFFVLSPAMILAQPQKTKNKA